MGTMAPRPAATFLVRPIPSEPAIPVRRITMPLARRFYQICVAMVSDSLADADLTPLQYGVLAYLNKDDGEPGIDQIGLAARLGVDRNNASVIVGELEERGLVERRVIDGDRRGRHVHLTAQGEKLYLRLLPNNAAANDRILAPLKPHERELLRDFLVRVIQGNAAYARPGAGRRKRGRLLADKRRPSNPA
jgi:DNA-binding MarR family transcriptional regulator